MTTIQYNDSGGSTPIWHAWTSNATCASDTNISSTWIYWNTTQTHVTNTATQVWSNWVTGTTATISNEVLASANSGAQTAIWQVWTDMCERDFARVTVRAAPTTPEAARDQMERMRLQQEESTKRIAAAEKKAREAEARAEALLLECLSLRQRQEYEQTKSFVVHGRKARYRIGHGKRTTIDVIDRTGMITHRLCVHPTISVPVPDIHLTQKLLLEGDEDYLLSKANIHSALNANEVVLPELN